MSFHNNFGHSQHPGFIRRVDPQAARRQLRMSVGVAAILSLAILGSAAVIRPASGYDLQAQQAQYQSARAVAHQPVSADLRPVESHGG